MFQADLVLLNGNIRTLDDHDTLAQAVAAFGESIISVGSDTEIKPLIGPGTQIINLGGRTVLPGFIDAHEHLSWFAEKWLNLDLSPSSATDLETLQDLIRREAQKLGPGEWVRGVGFDNAKFSLDRPLHRDDLDAAAPDNPVIVVHISGHWAVVNSKALTEGDLDRDSPDPEGGALGREPGTGRLNGLLLEMAMFDFAFESLARTPTIVPPYPRDARYQSLQKAAAFLNAAGITGVGDALTAPSYVTTYLDLDRDDRLSLRVNMIIPFNHLDRLKAVGLTGGWGSTRVTSSGVKVIVDGAIAGHTAAMQNGYADDPRDHGVLLIETQEKLDEIVRAIHDQGFQACIHANGDLAIDMALNSIERARAANPRPDPRHRIEHCTLINDRLVDRVKKLGVTPTPFVSYVWQHAEKLLPYYGPLAEHMFPHGTFFHAGIKPASGSDHPVGLHAPLLGVQCMVTRKTPRGDVIGESEKISVDEAFRVYTVNAAYAMREERVRGMLTPRRLADMVVLNRDPWTVPPDELGAIGVDLTIVGGRIVYENRNGEQTS